jgi:Zn finger protein HypA/HybF involved in hydrogenase expression
MAEVKVAMEQTECYQCEEPIEAEVGQVHPLCEECQADFDDWFTRALRSQV